MIRWLNNRHRNRSSHHLTNLLSLSDVIACMKAKGVLLLLVWGVFGMGHEMCSLVVPRFQVNQRALQVFAELVL